jgi:hypothetical protein
MNIIRVLNLDYFWSLVWVYHCYFFVAIDLVHLQALVKVTQVISVAHQPAWFLP